MAFVTAYLAAAWAEGIDISGEEGLRKVAGNAGLDWDQLQRASRGHDWESVLDDNLKAHAGSGSLGSTQLSCNGRCGH